MYKSVPEKRRMRLGALPSVDVAGLRGRYLRIIQTF